MTNGLALFKNFRVLRGMLSQSGTFLLNVFHVCQSMIRPDLSGMLMLRWKSLEILRKRQTLSNKKILVHNLVKSPENS